MSLRKNIRSKVYFNEVVTEYGLDPVNRVGRNELNTLKETIETNYASDIPQGRIIALSNGYFIKAIENSKGVVVPPFVSFLSGQTEVGIQASQTGRNLANGFYSGTAVDFTPTTIGGGRITSYLWNFGDGGTSTNTNTSHTYAAPGNYTVTLTATNLEGSVSNTKMINNAVVYNTLQIIAPPSAYVVAEGGSSVVGFRLYNDNGTLKFQYKVLDTFDIIVGAVFGETQDQLIGGTIPTLNISWSDQGGRSGNYTINNANNPMADWATAGNISALVETTESNVVNINFDVTDGFGTYMNTDMIIVN